MKNLIITCRYWLRSIFFEKKLIINRYVKLPTVAFALFLMLGFIDESQAQARQTTLYVDASYNGSTASDGTETYPFITIRAALDYRGNVQGITGMVSDEEIVVKTGTYSPDVTEMIFITSSNGGKSSYRFTLRADGDVFIDGTNLYTKKFASLIAVTSGAENVKVQGFKLKGMRNNQSLASIVNGVLVKDTKFGIQLANTVKNVEITDNEIYDFSWTLDVDPMKNRLDFTANEITILKTAQGGDNSGAINVTGTDLIPITNLVIKNNYIHNIIPGWTEAIQVNGNVDGFEISNNTITEVQNIGIVAAGHYDWVLDIQGATVTSALNYARNGVIKNNKVSSCRSPIAAAAGIYCDGSQNIIVENNVSSDGQVGFSIGNENSNTNSGGHTVRNNLSYDNSWAGFIFGVPDAAGLSYIDGVMVTGNTSFRNGGITDTYLSELGQSEVVINKNIKNLTVENNILYTTNHTNLVSVSQPFSTGYENYFNSISFDYNTYYTNSATSDAIFDWSQGGFGWYGNFAYYQPNNTLQNDQNSQFADPQFVDVINAILDLSLQSTSAAINAGNPAYVSANGESDYLGNNRVEGNIVDAGAYESGAVAEGDEAAAIDGVKSAGENYIALQTGITQGVWKNIYAYDDNNFIYVYAEYAGSLPEYSIYVNKNSSTGFQETWTEKSDYYVDGTLNLLNSYDVNGNSSWPFVADNSVMTVRFVQTGTTIEGRIPKYAMGIGNTGTVGLGIIGYTENWPTSVGSIPLENNAMVYMTLDGGSEAGSLSVDGYNSPVENYQPLITGVTNSSFSNIYGYVDSEYVYLYAEIAAANLSEYNVYVNTNSATGFQYLWTDKSNYFIDANYNVLNEYNGGSSGWPFDQALNSTGIEFVMTPTAVEGKMLKSLLGLGNSGTIGIGLEGHTNNWNSSLGGVPVNGNMVYLSLAESVKAMNTIEIPKETIDVVLKAYPNPAVDVLNINHLMKEDGPVFIELIGIDGRKYFARELHLKAGNQNHSITVDNFNRGIFILRIKTPEKVETRKILLK